MTKEFCDICRKAIKTGKIRISVRDFTSNHNLLIGHVFCSSCGKPILAFLTKNRLLTKQS